MRKILNPFKLMGTRHDYNCFGCSPFNEIGLQMEFWDNEGELIAKWQPRKSLEGWNGVLHGGIQASLADELGGWAVLTQLKTSGVTTELKMNYLRPLHISKGELTIKGKVVSFEKNIAIIECTIFDGSGEVCATSHIKYFCFPEKIARAKYYYPGHEAFYGV